jgi:hypothetical protein
MNKMVSALGAVFYSLVCSIAIAGSVHVDGSDFKDDQGRTLILRGVNLAGSSKIPATTSLDPKAVSFVGRPFSLSRADEHFRRLSSWGLTFERLIVPWESVEHAGPGQYDQAYLDYLHALVHRASTYGISVFIDFHQDFYSRATGGDGAPYWTLTKLGLQPDRTHEPGAPQKQPPRGPGYWPPTSGRAAVDTMETLFWAGNDFAPDLKVDGAPVQEWLQGHYVNAMRQVASRLSDLRNVVGYDTFNEPGPGFIGVRDLTSPEIFMMVIGLYAAPDAPPPSYWDLIRAASGYAPDKPTVPVNRLWPNGTKDIWRRYGVWDIVDGKPKLLKPDYFATVHGAAALHNTYLRPLYERIAKTIHEVAPSALIFQEPSTMGGGKDESMALGLLGMVSEPHWYDNVTLLSKRSTPNTTLPMLTKDPIDGRDAVLAAYVSQMKAATARGEALGGIPTLFGEVGIPFDMNDKEAYRHGDFNAQESLAGLIYEALDQTLSSYDIWTYNPDNTNEEGDHWNNEDMSIYSPDQRRNSSDINSGGRALKQIIRPYPIATAGKPQQIEFDPATSVFRYRYHADPAIRADTEIFLPKLQYPQGYDVTVQGGTYSADADASKLRVAASQGDIQVTVKPH